MSREKVISRIEDYFDRGDFVADLKRKVAFRTTSEDSDSIPVLADYLASEISPEIARIGFLSRIIPNHIDGCGPYLIAERIEDPSLQTILIYGHGDVVGGQDGLWREGASPWDVTVHGDRIYGRGTADNKGQLTINLAALESVIAIRGRLGFNVKLLVESAEERGSPGLDEFCQAHCQDLAADLLIASDGPRLKSAVPTIFLGSRGILNFELSLHLREGAHHSGNWGGLLRNAGTVLAGAVHSLVNEKGVIQVPFLRPPIISASVKQALQTLDVGGQEGDPDLDDGWGELGLSAAERVFGWNTLEVLALECGKAKRPIGAIQPTATAQLQLRYVTGTNLSLVEEQLRSHFINSGMPWVKVRILLDSPATRLDPDHPAAVWAAASILKTTSLRPAILPNLGGTIPNHVFARNLALPTVWIPHSYPACSQHAPNEHMLASVARQGLQIMAGLFWDLGEHPVVLAPAGIPIGLEG